MNLLRTTGAVCCLSVAGFFGVLTYRTWPVKPAERLDAVQTELAQARQDLAKTQETIQEAVGAAKTLLEALNKRTEGIPATVAALQKTVKSAQPILNNGSAALESANTVLQSANTAVNALPSTINAVGSAAEQTAAAMKDGRDSWDDMYWDFKALVETTTVTARSISETAGTIERAAPAQTKALTDTAEHVAGITEDVHTVTTQITKPKSLMGKIWEGIKVGSRLKPWLD